MENQANSSNLENLLHNWLSFPSESETDFVIKSARESMDGLLWYPRSKTGCNSNANIYPSQTKPIVHIATMEFYAYLLSHI